MLDVINSGSAYELDEETLRLIRRVTEEKQIHTLWFEMHYMYRHKLQEFAERFSPIKNFTVTDFVSRFRVLTCGLPPGFVLLVFLLFIIVLFYIVIDFQFGISQSASTVIDGLRWRSLLFGSPNCRCAVGRALRHYIPFQCSKSSA